MRSNIFDIAREAKAREKQKGGGKLADTTFLSNIDAIKGIEASPGFKLIKKYWETELLDSIKFLRDVDANQAHDVAKAQARLDMAQRFLSYLEGNLAQFSKPKD